jgi:hypothetical protein
MGGAYIDYAEGWFALTNPWKNLGLPWLGIVSYSSTLDRGEFSGVGRP